MGMFVEDESPIDNRQEHTIWCEKYRPMSVDEYVGSEILKSSLSNYIKSKDLPHILLHSASPGTGKTTAAKMIAKSIECDYLYINASDENSVDTIRNKVKTFASSMGFKPLKVLVLDEADFITTNGQAALRNLMETYAKSTRFILTCNYVDRIIAPVVSRCQAFEVIPPSKKDIALHLINILKKENITFNTENVAFLVNSFYPDIRKIINTAQQSSVDKTLSINQKDVVENDVKLKLIDLLKASKSKKDTIKEVRQLLADNRTSDYTEWFSTLYNHVDEYSKEKSADVIVTIAEHQYHSALVADKEINFSACIIQILDAIYGR
jgi:DNA polymerase III delta prime subunit